MRFENKTYLVTGGGRGIGRAITKRLVDDGARRWTVSGSTQAAGRYSLDDGL